MAAIRMITVYKGKHWDVEYILETESMELPDGLKRCERVK